ncbi:hypothetical protein [Croceitalea sp. MTPC5]|uniref:hypothetical protein n=1 Tax=Croceitalea sp. MTPC5 TaxID=3056565 RepID=UPI0030CF2041
MDKIKKKLWAQIFIIYTRYLIGGAFVFASLVKVMGGRFTAESGASNPIDSAWHFFETLYASGLYWKFIGVAQLVSGFLLMTQRYSKLAALVNLPIILNIFMITLSYYFAFTPVITGLMLLANILLIVWEWNELKIIFNLRPTLTHEKLMENDKLWSLFGLVLFVQTLFCKLFLGEENAIFWLLSFPLLGLLALVLGLKRERKRRYLIQVNPLDT